jgi:hypothetical protein
MTSPAPQATAPNTVGITRFFTDPGFDFVTRSMIGYAAQGVMDVGQVFATNARVRDGDADSWYAAWRATAEKFHGQASASLTAGHTATAHRQFLSASVSFCLRRLRAGNRFRRWTDGPHHLCASLCPADGMLGGARRHVGWANRAHRRAL